jgi:Arc/MetJ family transcription regulator
MKTTIDIPEEALRDAMRFTKAKTKREAILTVLEDFNRRRRMAELVKFSGTCKEMMSFDELMELRERDLPKAARLYSK